jgi:mono/diheme cytochrome c family protein
MKRVFKWIGIGLGSLVGLALLAVAILNVMSMVRQRRTYAVTIPPITIPTDSASLERGKHLVTTVSGCTGCHTADLGGEVMANSLLMGRLSSANLTRGQGGVGARYSDQDLVRAIRHGVRRDGRSVVFMPSESFQSYSDADLAAIIAYVRTFPQVNRTLPPIRIGPVIHVMHIMGFPLFPAELIDHAALTAKPVVVSPEPAITVEYGEYLVHSAGCRGCHGPELAGGGGPGPNLRTARVGAWAQPEFLRLLREGKRPDGTTLSEQMPWKTFGKMTDLELGAVWTYLHSLPRMEKKT